MFLIIRTIALSEFRSLYRQKTVALLLAVFLGMTLFSTYIGWSAQHTIIGVYEETVNAMAAKGVTEVPANPFLNTPPLAIVKNMVVYVLLIGSLLAIVVGYHAFMRERRAGVAKIIFSKPISRNAFICGKMVGILLVLASVMTSALIISILSVSLVSSRMLSWAEIGRLMLFYGISLGYVSIFAMIGLLFAIHGRSESLALLIPVVIWLLISFVLPQLTSALDPTALLNPTSIQPAFPQSHFFKTAQAIIEPFSISEHYKRMGRTLLEDAADGLPVWSSGVMLLASMFGCFAAIKRFNVCAEELNE